MKTDDGSIPSPTKILIAEDSATQAQRLRHSLEQHGYSVAVAANGRLALQMIPEFQPALVISDVVMPEVDGYELSRRIKEDAALRDIPVILVTTMSDPQDVIRGLECGADNFVLKPYDERYLIGRIRYVLANREFHQPQDAGMGVELWFNEKKHYITAGRLQILNLLLSTYDAAIQRNKELQHSQGELRSLNSRLEDVNKELESFSYSVSHDLRSPLRSINGFSQMLARDPLSTLSSEGRRYLDIITEASRQMDQLIDDLLEFSKMGRAEMRQSSVELEAVVGETIRTLEMASEGRNIAWRVGPLPRVIGDAAMLRQVFANLLGNAVKYTRPRDAAVIEIDTAGELEGRVVISVRDNGVGFDMQYADKLFGVFQRLHRADEFEGTGIGLASVRRIIERHGGATWAEAKADQGAAFYFTLAPERRQIGTPR
ncbi:MAG: response receiver histidine kinase [Ramlibacter sp.]|jgi:two-component system sensor histidine kinase/response regulator|nr:response receiver histidine kinase [Ramlibacter sp.]